jgi:hypothetical protein
MIRLTRADLQSVKMESLRSYAAGEEGGFFGKAEHYRLLAHLSTLFSGKTIFDIGTHHGNSALALSYGGSQVESFDVVDMVGGRPRPANVRYHLEDIFDPAIRERWRSQLLDSSIIFIDVDPHHGICEHEMVRWLQDNGYSGLIGTGPAPVSWRSASESSSRTMRISATGRS